MLILLVEDDTSASRFLKKGLCEVGYAVDAVFDGEEGLHMAQSMAYVILILAIMLPEMNGFEVLKALRWAGFIRSTWPVPGRRAERGLGCRSANALLMLMAGNCGLKQMPAAA